jgi:hypothetical protein
MIMRLFKWFILFSLLAPFLVCDPYSIPVNFRVQLDGGSWVEATAKTDITGTYLYYDLAPVATGSHTIKARAYNEWGESADSLPFSFTKAVPAVPGTLKIK